MDQLIVADIPAYLVVQVSIQIALAAFVAAWCLKHFRAGPWASLGTVGSCLFLAVNASLLFAYTQGGSALRWTWEHAQLLGWVQVTALVLFVLAMTLARPRIA